MVHSTDLESLRCKKLVGSNPTSSAACNDDYIEVVKFDMQKLTKVLLGIISVLLILNGLLNIWDDARVLVYDITSILAGIGFFIVNISLHKK